MILKKKILILFPDRHIAFSPTTLGIYDALSQHCDVTIYCPTSKKSDQKFLDKRQIKYFSYTTKKSRKLKALPAFLFYKIISFFDKKSAVGKLPIYNFVSFLELKKQLRYITDSYDEVIAVDVLFLYAAQSFFTQVNFLSLEIKDVELPLLQSIKNGFIKSVIIQTTDRYNYLFPDKKYKTFLIQNAPVFTEPSLPINKTTNALLFNGTGAPWFGIYTCLKFIKLNPTFSLTFKGEIFKPELDFIKKNYANLVESKHINIFSEYIDSNKMIEFMSSFEIGFCFYDLSFPSFNTFNYQTAPSGKMFAYFAAGVPVIGNNIPGLKAISEFGAGILIDDFNNETILKAIEKIQSNYQFYQENCYKAARHYSFNKSVLPFVTFISA